MPVVCPGCETELDASNTHCPVCLRQRSRKEIMEGLRAPKAARSRRWLLWLLLLLVGAGLHLYSLELRRRRPVVARAVPPQVLAPEPAPEFHSPDGQRPTVAVLSEIVPAQDAPPPRTRAEPAEPRPERASRGPAAWVVRGLVYDLISLRPVSGARLVFQDRGTGKAFGAKTDGAGRYRVSLPKVRDGGYELTIQHARYEGAYLEEMSPPYRRQGAERRREAAEQLRASEILHVPLLPEFEQDELAYDLVLFPPR